MKSARWRPRYDILKGERVRLAADQQQRQQQPQVHHRFGHLIVTPPAVKDISAGWVDFRNGVPSSDKVWEAFGAIIHVAGVGCVEAARQSCTKHRRLPPRTALFCLQDYMLEICVEERRPNDDSPDGAVSLTTVHLDFGYAMAYPCYECKTFRPNGSSILDVLRYNPECPEPTVPLEILSFLNKARMIRTFSKECQAGLENGTHVLAIHNTRPLVGGSASIERMVFSPDCNFTTRVQSSSPIRKRSRASMGEHMPKGGLAISDTQRIQAVRTTKRAKRAREFKTP